MGLQYSLGIVTSIVKISTFVWYLAFIVTLLQVILSFAFLICRPKVLKLIRKRFNCQN